MAEIPDLSRDVAAMTLGHEPLTSPMTPPPSPIGQSPSAGENNSSSNGIRSRRTGCRTSSRTSSGGSVRAGSAAVRQGSSQEVESGQWRQAGSRGGDSGDRRLTDDASPTDCVASSRPSVTVAHGAASSDPLRNCLPSTSHIANRAVQRLSNTGPGCSQSLPRGASASMRLHHSLLSSTPSPPSVPLDSFQSSDSQSGLGAVGPPVHGEALLGSVADTESRGAFAGDTLSAAGSSSDRFAKPYDYLLKFLLVGDSDVGKEEILQSDSLKNPGGLSWDVAGGGHLGGDSLGSPPPPHQPPPTSQPLHTGQYDTLRHDTLRRGARYTCTTLDLDGKRVQLQLWSASGQGRFSTVLRSSARGAHGILLVYDITNKYSFLGLDRWLQEVEDQAPGLPRLLIGNRLHLAFNRKVNEAAAEAYARKRSMRHYEVSTLCDYNVVEAFARLARDVLARNGMGRVWGERDVLSLSELCARTIVERTTLYGLEHLTLPTRVKAYLKYYSMTHKTHARCGAEEKASVVGKGKEMAGMNGSRAGGRRLKERSKSMRALRPPKEVPGAGEGSGVEREKKTCVIS